MNSVRQPWDPGVKSVSTQWPPVCPSCRELVPHAHPLPGSLLFLAMHGFSGIGVQLPWHRGSAPLAFPDCSYSMYLALGSPLPTCDYFHGNFLRREIYAVVPLPIRDSESGQQGFLSSFPSCGVFVNHLLIIYDNGLETFSDMYVMYILHIHPPLSSLVPWLLISFVFLN